MYENHFNNLFSFHKDISKNVHILPEEYLEGLLIENEEYISISYNRKGGLAHDPAAGTVRPRVLTRTEATNKIRTKVF